MPVLRSYGRRVCASSSLLPALSVTSFSVPADLPGTVRDTDAGSRDERAPTEDVVLAQALVDGRPEAALVAWRRFHPLVERTLRRMLGPGGDLQDLTQEVFLRFFGKVPELKKLESLRSFVMAIAIRRAQEEIKRRRVRRWFAPFLGEAVMRSSITEMDPEAREAVMHLYSTIDRLNVTDRTIYVLRFIEGLEQAEISEAMQLSVSTVRRRLDRLTKRMNSLMRADPVLADYLRRGRPQRGSGTPAAVMAGEAALAGDEGAESAEEAGGEEAAEAGLHQAGEGEGEGEDTEGVEGTEGS
jgi:RNA polymerase sigma-70 factor (ECF subfamily)